MKRASLFALVVLSLAVVLGCPSKPAEKGSAALADSGCCYEVKELTRQVDLTINYDSAKGEFTIDGIYDVYLSAKAHNKIRWRVENKTPYDVGVDVDTFRDPVYSSVKDPFPTTNAFKILPIKPGGHDDTGDSQEPKPTGGIVKTFRYKITFTLTGAMVNKIIVDPRVVVGD